LAILSTYHVDTWTRTQLFEPPHAQALPPVVDFLESHNLTYGYAAYFNSAAITAISDEKIHVYPIYEGPRCDPGYCSGDINTMESWYSGNNPPPVFVLIDPGQPSVSKLPANLGTPIAQYDVNGRQIYVFSHDIADIFVPQK
jgi:hypothetical protein